MAALLKDTLKQIGQPQKADDDLVDRLNHRYTAILLVTLTAFVSAKQFVGDPIACFAPSQFSGTQVAYTNSICWLKGTYYLANERRNIPYRTENEEFHIAYYQFVPYVLLIMAALFYFPHMLWCSASRHYGFDLSSIIEAIKTLKTDIHSTAVQIHATLNYHPNEKNKYATPSPGNRLSFFYMMIKLLYLINCLGQLLLLGRFLSFPFYRFGYDWFVDIQQRIETRANGESSDSKWFPRVVMCDFMVRHLGSNQHWMAVQCNLPINLFNELIFLIIWFWLLVLTLFTCVSFIRSLVQMLTKYNYGFIHKYLDMNKSQESNKNKEIFINSYLRYDGVLVLRLIDYNTNDIIMANLIDALYRIYLQQPTNDHLNPNIEHVRVPSNGNFIPATGSAV